MNAMQAAPVPPQTFDSTQGQIDALLASIVSIIQIVPEGLKPALREALAGNQIASRDSALQRPEFSDEYLEQHDQVCGAVWRLSLLGTPPRPFQ